MIDGTIGASVQVNDRRVVGLNSNANIGVNLTPSITFSDGSGALMANQLYQAQLAMTAGVYNLDLNGILTDAFGSSVVMLRVKAIFIRNDSVDVITVGGHATAAMDTLLSATGTFKLPPGAWFLAATPDATGWGVTVTTKDIIKLAGTSTDAFTVIVLGATS